MYIPLKAVVIAFAAVILVVLVWNVVTNVQPRRDSLARPASEVR